MHNIVLGIKRNFANGVEKFLEETNYEKTAKDESVFFEFSTEDKEQPEIMSFLTLHAGRDNYGYVRFGPDVTDIEIAGTLENFDIRVTRDVARYE